MRDELTDEDRRRLAHTQAILDGRTAGRSMKEIAAELGEPRTSLAQFARGGIYRTIAEYLRELEETDDAAVAEETVKRTRVSLASMAPHVRDYVRHATRKRSDGMFEDEGAAMWAAQFLAKTTGVDTPERAVRPSINIHIDTIQTMVGDIKRDGAQAIQAAGAMIEGVAEAVEEVLEMENGA